MIQHLIFGIKKGLDVLVIYFLIIILRLFINYLLNLTCRTLIFLDIFKLDISLDLQFQTSR